MFKKILVPIDVDRPNAAKAVYKCAAEIAEQSGAEIKVLGVMADLGMPIVGSFISDEIRKEACEHFRDEVEAFVKENCGENVSYHIRAGKNHREIIKLAKKWEADLIIVYHNRTREINEVFSSSCSQHVYSNAPCSVLRLRNLR